MNKLLLADKANNYISIFPLKKDIEIPENKEEQIEWCKKTFENLQKSTEAKRLHIYRNVKSGILVSVWELDNYYYIIQSIRKPLTREYNNIIYINTEKEDSIQIAKVLTQNYRDYMKNRGNFQENIENFLKEQEPLNSELPS